MARIHSGGGSERRKRCRAEARMAFDQSSSVEDQLNWMRDAGFNQVDCTFKAWRFAVLAGWKSKLS